MPKQQGLIAVADAEAAEAARLIAVADAEAAEAARLIAVEAARLAEVARAAEETAKIAAEELAALLKMVNPIEIVTATGYGSVTPGVYEIASGGTADAGDVTFACPADGPLCVVVVNSG